MTKFDKPKTEDFRSFTSKEEYQKNKVKEENEYLEWVKSISDLDSQAELSKMLPYETFREIYYHLKVNRKVLRVRDKINVNYVCHIFTSKEFMAHALNEFYDHFPTKPKNVHLIIDAVVKNVCPEEKHHLDFEKGQWKLYDTWTNNKFGVTRFTTDCSPSVIRCALKHHLTEYNSAPSFNQIIKTIDCVYELIYLSSLNDEGLEETVDFSSDKARDWLENDYPRLDKETIRSIDFPKKEKEWGEY